MNKIKIYLDDVRTPVNTVPENPDHYDGDWVVVRDYDEFIAKVQEVGLHNIGVISLDHDLGETAMSEYYNNVANNYTLDYNNIKEKTGYDCAKWLVSHFYDTNPWWEEANRFIKKPETIPFPVVHTHSANPIGSANIMGYINNFLKNEAQPQTCSRVRIHHTV